MGKKKKQKHLHPDPAPGLNEKKAPAPGINHSDSHNGAHLETFPMNPEDNILLVGEGDFSFAVSLVEEHGCAFITATGFDSEKACCEKYQHAASNTKTLCDEGMKVHFGIDAGKLHKSRAIRDTAGPGYDLIIFNFPHVGGKSTDRNRQVRYNQELIVSFFQSATHLLSGTILVTLFEGEPYTLWNIRDLARHCGLKLVKSFKFDGAAFPGYSHRRTLGDIEGGWKGEDRKARSYVFGKADAALDSSNIKTAGQRGAKKRKRNGGAQNYDSDDDSE